MLIVPKRIQIFHKSYLEIVSTIIMHLISYPGWPHTPGGRTGKVLVSHAEDAGSRPVKAAPIYMYCVQWGSGGTALLRVGSNGQSIGSTVSDAIVRSWL